MPQSIRVNLVFRVALMLKEGYIFLQFILDFKKEKHFQLLLNCEKVYILTIIVLFDTIVNSKIEK